jgi:hypothetical protein
MKIYMLLMLIGVILGLSHRPLRFHLSRIARFGASLMPSG